MTNQSANEDLEDTPRRPKHNSMYDGSAIGEIIQLVSGLMSARVRVLDERISRKEFTILRENTYGQITALIQSECTKAYKNGWVDAMSQENVPEEAQLKGDK